MNRVSVGIKLISMASCLAVATPCTAGIVFEPPGNLVGGAFVKHRPWVVVAMATLLQFPVGQPAEAVARRAVVIGINAYEPAAGGRPSTNSGRNQWVNLNGAVNDACAMRDILVARFGFSPDDVVLLTDSLATGEAIVARIRENLIAPARPGDICVFFYAGHGSRVFNSESDEPDKMDETIVPADAVNGTPDIRDKRLRRLFNEILDKGAKLTVIFDSCHSGSISRGMGVDAKSRSIAVDPRDYAAQARLDGPPGPVPASRGALVLAAAQEEQGAKETMDGQAMPHGVFSFYLLQTLRQVAPTTSADRVFKIVKAKMQSSGRLQEPGMETTPERRGRTLFDDIAGDIQGKTIVALLSASSSGECELQAGLASGICVGSILRGVERREATAPAEGGTEARGIRLQVESVQGLSHSTARVISGDASVLRPGYLLEVEGWAACDEPLLRVWASPAVSPTDLTSITRLAIALRESGRVTWVEDPTREQPTHVVWWSRTGCHVTETDSMPLDLGTAPTRDGILRRITGGPTKPRLFVSIPSPAALWETLGIAPGATIEPSDEPGSAHYVLAGRLSKSGGVEYSWVLPEGALSGDAALQNLPLRTNWVEFDPGQLRMATARLKDLVQRLGQIRTWMQLESPPDDGFACGIELRDAASGKKPPEETLREGESYDLYLRVDRKSARQLRYVYVFTVDSEGEQKLLFPRLEEGNSANTFPMSKADAPDFDEVKLPRIKITEPFGLDTFIVLSTVESIPDPSVLDSPGVMRRGGGPRSDVSTPLSRLLEGIGSGTRGVRAVTPVSSWSIERLMVRTGPRQ